MSRKSTLKHLILVDGSSYLFRAFHALPPLTNSKGEPTGAVYGVTNMLRKLLKDYDPDYIAVVFDAKGKTFRDELFEQYKAHRPPMPEDLIGQIEPLHAIVRAMGLPCLIVDGVEADDVIGTLATRARGAGIDTTISTGDKDMAQLVDKHITLINTMTGTELDTAGVREKFGVAPNQIIDYLALIGDTSDNIPGIPGVGPKTAAKWLNEYDSLDNIVAHADEIKGKVGEKLRSNLVQLPLSRQLATIKCDVSLDVEPGNLQQHEPDVEKMRTLFQQLEFKRWLAELTTPGSADTIDDSQADVPADAAQVRKPSAVDKRYETILSDKNLQRWLKRLQQAELFAFDTETTSLDYMNAEVVGVSFAVKEGEAAYVPLAHDYPDAPQQLSREQVLETLRPLLEDPDKAKLGQNLKYDMSVLFSHGIHLQGIRFDTMLESYVLNSTATRHDMDSLALKYLGYRTIAYKDIAKQGARVQSFNEIAIEQAAPYAAEDADITLRLHNTLWPQLGDHKALRQLFEDIEMPLVPVLSRIERNGVLVDAELLDRQSGELAGRIAELEQQAYEMAGESFNLGSPKQIQEILYNKLGLPVLRKTPKGQPSTAESTLQELAMDYPLPKLILDHRGLSKLKSTYTDKLPGQINTRTGRVHTSYHQAIASTGRLSSSDPNLQNIPVRSEEGRRIRQAFIAPEGYQILAADYSQIELRILAHLSDDQGLKQAFNEGADIHRATAAEIFSIPPQSVTPLQRRNAKAINFGLIYGMSAFGLARQLGIGRNEAQSYMDLYFSRYPKVKGFMDQMREQAREQGYVETLYGRRLYLPEINSRNAQRRQYAERAAINAPMQGTAADIIKLAMLATDNWLNHKGKTTRMIMQVHDELVFEVAADEIEATTEQIRNCMTNVVSLTVPLIIDIGIGANWDEAH